MFNLGSALGQFMRPPVRFGGPMAGGLGAAMAPTMGTAIRGMFGGGGGQAAPSPMGGIGGAIGRGMAGGALGGMLGGGRPAPVGGMGITAGAAAGMGSLLRGGGSPHVVGAWGQAHPEIIAQRQAARRAKRGLA